jgi:hypothetical protein
VCAGDGRASLINLGVLVTYIDMQSLPADGVRHSVSIRVPTDITACGVVVREIDRSQRSIRMARMCGSTVCHDRLRRLAAQLSRHLRRWLVHQRLLYYRLLLFSARAPAPWSTRILRGAHCAGVFSRGGGVLGGWPCASTWTFSRWPGPTSRREHFACAPRRRHHCPSSRPRRILKTAQ